MFERYDSLLDRVGAVTRRYRAVRFWWLIAMIAASASIIGWWLLGEVRTGLMLGQQAAIGLLVSTVLAAMVALFVVRFSYRNPRWVAAKIESRFPGLQQRLLTAPSQSTDRDQQLGYLQRRVISDAYQHSLTHRWSQAVSPAASLLSRVTGGLSLLVLAFVTTTLVRSTPSDQASNRSRSYVSPNIIIEPGDAEVEKGSGLVISARFPTASTLPDKLELLAVGDEASEQRMGMSQSLNDPILSAYVPTIEKRFRYRVVSPDWQSGEYSVEVFEFPSLVRADALLDYPDYTQLDTKRVDDTVRVSAVEGTNLQWNLMLNKSVAKVTIRDKAGVQLEPMSVADQTYQMQFAATLDRTDRWTVELVDDQGRKNKYPITLDARVMSNRPPDLKLVRGGDVIASPLEELSLAATAQDDFGIVRTGITYSLAGGATQEVVLGESIQRGTKGQVDHLVELERLDAEPDQLLSYHFWAEDYDAGGEVRHTQSDLYFAEVRPFEEIFREGESPSGGQPQQQQGASQQTEKLAELQKQIIAATWKVARTPKDAKLIETFATDVKLLETSQQQAIEQVAELAEAANDAKAAELVATLTEQMESAVENLRSAGESISKVPLDAAIVSEQAAYQTLLRLRAREFEVSRSRQQRGQQSGGAAAQRRQQQLDQLELKNDENRYETQSQASDQNAQEDAQREDRQVLNRLKELAQRQEDINKQLTQLQSALEQAKSEEEKEEVRRQLKRLREQEQELLREADELAERMQQPENSQAMEQQAEQLEQTRDNLRKSSDALEQNNAAEALSAGKRAERELDEMSEEFRKRAAGEFDETVREMRSKARDLEQAQQQLGEQLQQMTDNTEPGLRTGGDREAIRNSLQEQQAALSNLLQQVQETVELAEPAEPLLAKNLYETYRQTQQNQLNQRMRETGELLRRGLDPQARQLQRDASESTSQLRRDLEKAAESVLGNEEKALERALSELERLEQAVQSELSQAQSSSDPSNDSQDQTSSQPSGPGQPTDGKPEVGKPGEGKPGEGKPGEGKPGEGKPGEGKPGEGKPGEGKPGEGKPGEGQAAAGQPGERSGRGEGTPRGQAGGGGGGINQLNQEGGTTASPIAGGGFREWSDGLRDVEEMVGDPALRSEAAAIRDRARQMRLEMRRHAQEPQWDLVESMIAKPLRELKMKVSEELLRRSADRAEPVPIDRDPVPDEFAGAVKRYYESLGSGR